MPDPTTRFQEAYAHHLPGLRALPPEKVSRPRVDVASAGMTILGCLASLKPHMEALASLPYTDKALVNELPTRTMTMLQAYANYVAATTPPAALGTLVERGAAVRQLLLDATGSLIAFKLLEPGPIAEIRAGSGHKDLAMDLLALVPLYRNSWDKVQSKTPVTSELLSEADLLADQILTALGERVQAGLTVSEATQLRDRAYTLFMESYMEVRRSLDYMRGRDGDADKILPSVFAYKRGKNGEEEPAPVPAPGPTNGGGTPSPIGGGGTPMNEPGGPFVS